MVVDITSFTPNDCLKGIQNCEHGPLNWMLSLFTSCTSWVQHTPYERLSIVMSSKHGNVEMSTNKWISDRAKHNNSMTHPLQKLHKSTTANHAQRELKYEMTIVKVTQWTNQRKAHDDAIWHTNNEYSYSYSIRMFKNIDYSHYIHNMHYTTLH